MDVGLESPKSLSPNCKLGEKYRLIRLLGRGGMGEVWLARNEATGAQVALKALHPKATLRKVDSMGRFRREARVAGLLSHRHIIQIFDLVEEPGGPIVLVMELLRGENLDSYVDRTGPLTTHEAVAIILPILSALQHAHDAGVVHRDVTPANIFLAVDSDGHVIPKLVDFGIAKHVEGAFQTSDGEVLGTPCYMAPELIRGSREFDGTSDLFSIGVVLFELITGAGPFVEPSPAAALAAVLEKTVDPDERIDPRVWIELSRALSMRPYERHRTAGELAAALRVALGCDDANTDVTLVLRHPPQTGVTAGDLSVTEVTGPATAQTGTVQAPVRPWLVRGTRRAIAFGVVAAAGIAAVSAVRLSDGRAMANHVTGPRRSAAAAPSTAVAPVAVAETPGEAPSATPPPASAAVRVNGAPSAVAPPPSAAKDEAPAPAASSPSHAAPARTALPKPAAHRATIARTPGF